MMEQTVIQQVLTIFCAVAATILTRALPFCIWTDGQKLPPTIHYLGRMLPTAIFGVLVVFCLKDISFFSGTHGLPELAAIAVTAILHVLFRRMFLSMAGGTVCYMVLVNFIFRAV